MFKSVQANMLKVEEALGVLEMAYEEKNDI